MSYFITRLIGVKMYILHTSVHDTSHLQLFPLLFASLNEWLLDRRLSPFDVM
jgi:hypothetical protein